MNHTLQPPLRRLWAQPPVGVITAGVAVLADIVAWCVATTNETINAPIALQTLLAIILILATITAYQFPIHIYRQTKVYMASVPYYLMAALLTPPLAATVAGLGALCGEVSVKAQRGTSGGNIAAEAGRRTVLVLLGALATHAMGTESLRAVGLVAAACILGVGDVITFPLVLINGRTVPPLRLIAAAAREAYLVEGAQYLLGLLGVLAVTQQTWALVLLIAPTILVYLAFRSSLQAAEAQRLTREAQQMAERAVRVRDEFLTTASHDLRTPLTVMIGQIELMRMRLEHGEPADAAWLNERIRAASSAGKRMHAIVDEITDAAQHQVGHDLALHLEPLHLDTLVDSVVANAMNTAADGRAPVVVEDAAPVLIFADRRRLERVLENVVDNAIKYTINGLPVVVRVHEEASLAVVTVRDRGIGIPPAELPHIFTHFYRASTTRTIQGTGVGLASARGIVEQHGGHINVESTVGEGTTVTIHLPHVPSARHVAPQRRELPVEGDGLVTDYPRLRKQAWPRERHR